MKCEICNSEIPKDKNSVVCSEICSSIRTKMIEIKRKYFPTNGCQNCWGDLHQGCSEQCKKEFREASIFNKDLWSLIRLIYPKKL